MREADEENNKIIMVKQISLHKERVQDTGLFRIGISPCCTKIPFNIQKQKQGINFHYTVTGGNWAINLCGWEQESLREDLTKPSPCYFVLLSE